MTSRNMKSYTISLLLEYFYAFLYLWTFKRLYIYSISFYKYNIVYVP